MTYSELKIKLDLNHDSRVNILKNVNTCQLMRYGYLFVDSEDGQCYLFDKNGNLDDINKVKRIDGYAFSHCKSLTSIKIPDSVTSIGYTAFYDCNSLKSIKIPNSIKSIGNYAFENCISLTSINIPSSVEWIGHCVFENCTSLKQVVFEGKTIDQVKAMDNYPWGIKDESIVKCYDAMLSLLTSP